MPTTHADTDSLPRLAVQPSSRRRGSKPGVKRGPYKPQNLRGPEPIPEQLDRWCRDCWGDDSYEANDYVFHHQTRKLVSVRSYLPPDSIFSPDHKSKGHETKWRKKCSGCAVLRQLNEFGPNGRGGYKARCKSCLAKAAHDYANTPEGKVARARAQAKHEATIKVRMAVVKAREATLAARERFIAECKKTEAGTALLDRLGLHSKLEQPTAEC
ncbi:MAG: hypothetical protein EON54_18185 [Alcaligenaceae bacterium]|nr:MAG: hypothetical protein EON54_18185 [Alcaligenaceae bacterium]